MKAKLTRRIFAILLVIAMILTLVPAAFAASFSDVPAGAWYDEAVTYCEDNGIMSGVGGGKFNPSGKVPREQSVQALYALDGSHAVPFEALFSDVKDGQWFAPAVTWGAKNGIVAGMSTDKFGVGQNVTREQMAAFFFRYAGFAKADTSAEGDLSVFPDKDDTSAYAVSAIKWAVGEGIISGVKQNDGSVLLKPKDPLTRAQLAVMMMKFHQLINAEPQPIDGEIFVPSTKRDGVEIPTYVTLPENYDPEQTYDLVILIHGHGGNHNEWGGFDPITNGLAAKGVIAVTQDFSGCGDSKESFRLNTMTNMKNDVLDVLAYMAENYNIGSVGAMGYSMGGRIALELTAEELYSFDKLEFVAPAEDYEDLKNLFGGHDNWELLEAEANEKGFVEYTTIYATQELSKEWFADLAKYPDGLAEAAIEKFDGESFTIYALDDQAVAPFVSQGVADIFGSPVINTRSGGHSYSFYVTDEANHPMLCKQVNLNTIAFFTGGVLKDYYEDALYSVVIPDGADMLKYGHIDIAIPADEFLETFAYGDMVTVELDGYGTFTVPVCASYDDVAAGEMLLRVVSGKSYVILAINYGQIAVEQGIVEKAPEGADTAYVVKEDVTFPIAVTIKPQKTSFESIVIPDGADMLKYGHIDIDIPADEFLAVFPLGSTVTVTLDGYGSFDVPVCASYDDVAAGEMLLRAVSGKTYLILAINYGQIAVEQGIVEKAPDGASTAYVVKEDVTFPINVTITKKITQVKSVVIPDGADMLKYGHIDIDYPADDFLTEFELGDIVTVELEGYGTYEVPVCASYDDVAAGEPLLRVVSGKTYLILAINYGQIAVQEGLVEKAEEGAATAYVVKDGVSFPINVTITLKAKGDSGNTLGDLIRTDVRTDYPELSDAQFANFRKVTTTGIKDGILYRSSSPINPEIGRNLYADAAAAEAGVKTFINLADTEAEATKYPDYATSYYSEQNHIFLGLPVAFTTDTFKNGLANGFRYIIANEGPYLVHCTEGKDRAGLTSAILECLMGASYDEVVDDYVETYRNYYSVENGAQRALTDKEEAAAADVILANLKLSFGVEITPTTDLAAAAEAYMKSIGLSDEEIAALKARLGGEEEEEEADWVVADSVEAGDHIIITAVYDGTLYALSTDTSTVSGAFLAVPVDFDGEIADDIVFAIEAGSAEGTFALKSLDDRYIKATDSGTGVSLSKDPVDFIFNFGTDSVAISLPEVNRALFLRGNNGEPQFRNYALQNLGSSGYCTAVTIYKFAG